MVQNGTRAEAVPQPKVPEAGHIQPREVRNPFPADVNWSIVHHRIVYSKENGKPCRCETCREYLDEIWRKYWP